MLLSTLFASERVISFVFELYDVAWLPPGMRSDSTWFLRGVVGLLLIFLCPNLPRLCKSGATLWELLVQLTSKDVHGLVLGPVRVYANW